MNRPPDEASSKAAVWDAGSRRLGYAIRRRIAALDPVEDNEEVARLTFEVLYGDPIAVHAALLIGFSRQVAVPSIARVIYRGGNGETLRDVARRIDDTLTLFGAFFHWGHSSPRGRAAIARMEQTHKRFAITDEQKLYTLATLIFEAERIGQHLRFAPFTANQREASWRFWRGVAEQMPLGGLPPTAEELWRWMLEYEREHWRYTDDGHRVVARFFEDWTTRWFPPAARGLGRQTLLALMDENLRAVLHLEDPSRSIQWLLRTSARAYLPLTLARPLPTQRSWMDHFARRL
jgi:mpaB/rubber oxygenase-like protein